MRYTGEAPLRLDAFLRREFPGLGAGALHRALRQNKIKVNGAKRPLATRLHAGDAVQLYLREEELRPAPPAMEAVFEDAHLLVANKPAGLATQGAGDTLESRAAAHASAGGSAPLLCHRLDTGTSGLVMLAKDTATLRAIEALQRAHAIEKHYLCAVLGSPQPPAATLSGWHTKDAGRGHVHITPHKRPGGKQAITQYQTLRAGNVSLLDVTLVTGRTHQIRAHLAAIGHPVLGDSKYGDLGANRRFRCKYQLLHAARITFPAVCPPALAAYSGLALAAPAPWFYTKLLDGTFGEA